MQKILHKNPNIHPLFDDIEYLYYLTSVKSTEKTLVLPQISDCFKDTINIFAQYSNAKYNVNFVKKHYDRIKVPKANKKIIVCFSGGKDSTAVVKYYLEHNYEVYLYHLRHINFALTDEYLRCQEIANYFKLPLFIDDIKLSEHNHYVEHPLKNWIIANGALQYGITNNICSNIAFGNYSTSSLDFDNFEFCGGDSVEMWQTYEKIIRNIIPRFKMHIILDNLGNTLESICTNRELLDKTVSCIGRANLREYHHKWVKDKFGIQLPNHRCGRCYKCCVEYIYMTDHNLQDYSKSYYKYCLDKLRYNMQREDGRKYSLDDVWNHYFFYDVSESKYF